MELGGRKLLPRLPPTPSDLSPVRHDQPHLEVDEQPWLSPMEEQPGQKRKRQRCDDNDLLQPAPQALPSVRHLLTGSRPATPSRPNTPSNTPRLVRTSKNVYVHDGPYLFLAPHPQRDFPVSVAEDTRPLSFAAVEPELMHVFRRAWYLRQYIRLKQMRSETWLDHIFFNDCFGVENTLHTWIARYEPGTLQYPASLLYFRCLWLLFNRSVQASHPSPAYAQVVDDGLHHAKTIEKALGASGDRSILLLPLFLLGVSAFYVEQRRDVWDALDRIDPSPNNDAVNHAAKTLERLWTMMDDGRVSSTWDWERYQAHEYTASARDRSLIDLLLDPLAAAPVAQPTHLRSPETHAFDHSRFRAVQPPAAPYPQAALQSVLPVDSSRLRQDVNMYTPPPNSRSPHRNHSVTSLELPDAPRMDIIQELATSRQHASTPRPAQPTTRTSSPPLQRTSSPHQPQPVNGTDALHQRKQPKSKSSVPPCPTCGKELKNPSDAQKHQLQHSKPFRCREPGCTRAQGFATENDLQRHRKSVHGASPRIGNKIGYVCAACPDPGDGTSRKWWPRLDNFKAHIRRKHVDREEEGLILASASAEKPGDGVGLQQHGGSAVRFEGDGTQRQEGDDEELGRASSSSSSQRVAYDYDDEEEDVLLHQTRPAEREAEIAQSASSDGGGAELDAPASADPAAADGAEGSVEGKE
ncbi:hypothetical protein BDY17DRAFT_28428 [Neohortaea acidophila]|uniref:C2H2-type domain-containing protein n=1 Tax=Neohortaea acidophila TaxID=245834 RepID=A0A6A6PJ11_9PEZI|nr:uncharacterized protein BDY17DRAFT_28428 [Neohortaea acidophila]KAF2479905.1 hypothetical protein BDY17DRAFT_28428 [Neohortaea acidophila]